MTITTEALLTSDRIILAEASVRILLWDMQKYINKMRVGAAVDHQHKDMLLRFANTLNKIEGDLLRGFK